MPTSDWVMLDVRAPALYGPVHRDFGYAGGRKCEPLRPGDNDLGDLVLPSWGGVSGRVTDSDGRPIARARVGGSITDVDGRYVASVEPGVALLRAEAQGFHHAGTRSIPVEVGRIVADVDFQLIESPTISGTVVDQDGAPIADVRIWGWPTHSGSGAGARTAVDGTFTIHLPQRDPYRLTATKDGFHGASEATSSEGHPPGSRDVRIILRKASGTRLQVVDADGGKRLEAFSVRRGGSGRTARPLAEATSGEVEFFVAQEETIIVSSPGYAPARRDMKTGSPADSLMTVQLDRAGRIEGRILVAGKPAAGAAISIEIDHESKQSNRYLDNSMALSDATGAFVVQDIGPGCYQVTVQAKHAAVRVIRKIEVKAGLPSDIGALDIVPESTLEGRMLVDTGTSMASFEVEISPFSTGTGGASSVRVKPDPDGHFKFEGLAAGEHTISAIRWQKSPGGASGIPAGCPVRLVIRERERVTLDLDLRDQERAGLVASVTINGLPARGCQISVAPADLRHSGVIVGTTDESGVATGKCPDGLRIVEARSANGVLLARSSPIELRIGSTVEVPSLPILVRHLAS
ncbi:MAG: carboxypeptidase regulatory-like domain-containing protein [Planctomycetes bacterium]|nr:carboxypeptidase regulatory-like domain-containing protein [Planctomycetota bacterium]